MDSGVFVHSCTDVRNASINDDSSESSSLGSSILVDDHLLQTPVRFHADSLESLNDDILQVNEEENLVFRNTSALQNDLRAILDLPEVCDVEFLVGRDEVPVYGVKAILLARSKTFLQRIELNQDTLRRPAKQTIRKRWMSHMKRLRKSPRELSACTWADQLRIPVKEFEPEIFRPLIVYLHCGSLALNGDTVVGIMNAADSFCLDQIRDVCFQFAESQITTKGVLPLLTSIEQYSNFKLSKLLLLQAMDFLTENAQDILQSSSFQYIPQRTALAVLSRSYLRATEDTKWKAALAWTRQNSAARDNRCLRKSITQFLPHIDFKAIPIRTLQQEIRPLSIVPEDVINAACHHQLQSRLVVGQEAPVKPVRRKSFRKTTMEFRAFILRKCMPVSRSSQSNGDTGVSEDPTTAVS